MSDNGEIIPTGRETVMRVKDTPHSHWRHVLKPDTDWHTALRREYWHSAAFKFRAGDRLDIVTFDYRIQIMALILAVNTAVDPAYIDWDFVAIYPRDLPIPKPDVQRAPAFVARPSPGSSGLYDVIKVANGELMRPSLMLLEAERQAANLDAAAKTAEEQMAAAAVAHFTRPATPEPTASKAAARMKRMRERRKQNATEGAAA
jgi:hypothetical protein